VEQSPEPGIATIDDSVLKIVCVQNVGACLDWQIVDESGVAVAKDIEPDGIVGTSPCFGAEVVGFLDECVFGVVSRLLRVSHADAVLATLEPYLAVSVDLEPISGQEPVYIKGASHWHWLPGAGSGS